jgi:hypothetical protein
MRFAPSTVAWKFGPPKVLSAFSDLQVASRLRGDAVGFFPLLRLARQLRLLCELHLEVDELLHLPRGRELLVREDGVELAEVLLEGRIVVDLLVSRQLGNERGGLPCDVSPVPLPSFVFVPAASPALPAAA